MAAAVASVPTLTPYPKRKGGGFHLTSGRHCIAAGNGLSGGVAGVASVVSVRCRDARNEVRASLPSDARAAARPKKIQPFPLP